MFEIQSPLPNFETGALAAPVSKLALQDHEQAVGHQDHARQKQADPAQDAGDNRQHRAIS